MKLTDKLVDKVGSDKLLHFSIGGWVTSLIGVLGNIPMFIGLCSVTILNVIKEYFFDKEIDWKDILATFIGGNVSVLIYILLNFIK